MSSGICAVCIFVEAAITAFANAVAAISRRATSVRRIGRRAASAGAVVARRCRAIDRQELAQRHLVVGRASMMSPGSTYGTCPSPRWTTISRHLRPRDPAQDGDLGGRRLAVDQPDRDDGVPAGRSRRSTAPGVAPGRERQRELGRSARRTTEIWGSAPSNPRVSRTSADDLADPEPERHQRNPSSRPRA